MRRILIIGMSTGLLSIAIPAGAQAACGTGCLRTKVNTLTRQLKGLTAEVNTLNSEVGTLNTTVAGMSTNFMALHGRQVTDEGTIFTLQSFETTFGN
jgi:hypothetical protein